MDDQRDIVEVQGLHSAAPASNEGQSSGDNARSKFLSVWYRCCNTYGRMTRNAAGTAYAGRCPKCGAKVNAQIGPGGTSQRVFEAS